MSQSDGERRRAILDAALACFLQFGYAKTSVDDIAKRAGLSRPLLYRKFKNKEEIFGACYDEVHDLRYPRIDAILAGKGGKRSKLERACEVIILEPWDLLCRAPAVAEFYDACVRVIPEIHERHEKKLFELTNAVIGDRELTDVFLLAVDGMFTDLPSVAVLRKRLYVLIDRFT